jgi:mono/diheme cytochrome c family protein
MKITTKGVKKFAIGLIALPILAMTLFTSTPVNTVSAAQDDTAALYKSKCAMCHGAKAEKTFDATKPDEQLAETVINGVKPKMPAYGEKGISADQAKALVAYMKQLKQ